MLSLSHSAYILGYMSLSIMQGVMCVCVYVLHFKCCNLRMATVMKLLLVIFDES